MPKKQPPRSSAQIAASEAAKIAMLLYKLTKRLGLTEDAFRDALSTNGGTEHVRELNLEALVQASRARAFVEAAAAVMDDAAYTIGGI